MKKYFILGAIICATVVLFSNCHSPKKSMATTTTTAPAVTYAVNMKSVVEMHCSPCHIPAKGGHTKPLDTYDNLKANIDEAISRIKLSPTDRGFMPFKHDKLSDSTIAVFTQWRDAGMPQ